MREGNVNERDIEGWVTGTRSERDDFNMDTEREIENGWTGYMEM